MKRMPWRLGVAVVLVLSMLGMVAPSPVAAQEGTASLTIHSRFCPENYDMSDVYNTCHDTVGDRGVQYNLYGSNPTGDMPDEDGNLTFADLTPGEYWLSNSFPSELHGAYVYCSSSLDSGQQLALHGGGLGDYMVNIVLDEGESMTCDWYTSPNGDFASTRASLTIHNRICPADYANFGNEWQDCPAYGLPYSSYFFIDDPLTRSHEAVGGNVSFSWLPPRLYLITSYFALPAGIYCSTFDSISMPFFEQQIAAGESIALVLDAGVDVICDWYYYVDPEWWQG